MYVTNLICVKNQASLYYISMFPNNGLCYQWYHLTKTLYSISFLGQLLDNWFSIDYGFVSSVDFLFLVRVFMFLLCLQHVYCCRCLVYVVTV